MGRLAGDGERPLLLVALRSQAAAGRARPRWTHRTVEDEVGWLSTADVRRSLAAGDLDGVVFLAVSLRGLWVAGERDWMAAEAVTRSLARE